MHEYVEKWFQKRTHDCSQWDVETLVRSKNGMTVSVVLPALNEQDTVGAIVATLRESVVQGAPLVDELIVIDAGSTDDTAKNAQKSGAQVVHARDIVPALGHYQGKGEVLWKSQFMTHGDITVFIDSDLVGVGPHYVSGLLGPLLSDLSVSLVKAFYDRPLITASGMEPTGGGRVSELVARPLLNLYWPGLAGIIQPLSGEYAIRRSMLEQLPLAVGYGVEIGILIDLLQLTGLDGIAQVDLGARDHSHQSDADLGPMAATIIQTALRRLPDKSLRSRSPTLTQFQRSNEQQRPMVRSVEVQERPPALSLAPYVRQIGRAHV